MTGTGRIALLCAVAVVCVCPVRADWYESFNNNSFDIPTWQFPCYPDIAKTFQGTIKDGLEEDDYMELHESSSVSVGGAAFGMAHPSNEQFTDVKVGVVFNVDGAGDSYCGIGARAGYIVDDGSLSGAPGMIANAYVLLMHWQDGPARVRIEFQKVVQNAHIHSEFDEVMLPGLDHARSHYVEFDIIGSDPTYIQGSVYEYKGGPLLARTPLYIDSSGKESWEKEGARYEPYTSGMSAVFGMNEDPEPAGFHCSFDEIFSTSNGPSALNPSPADGATVSPESVLLSWVEGSYATSRELWFGPAGAMEKISPNPTGSSAVVGPLEAGTTYQWRVDQIGAGGTVTGHTWSFDTSQCLMVDDFESYTSNAEIEGYWPHNIPPSGGTAYHYVFLETGEVYQGGSAMKFDYQNQYDPFYTEATRTFTTPQDWTAMDAKTLCLQFKGDGDNYQQPFYVKVEDSMGRGYKVLHPFAHAPQAREWYEWTIDLQQFAAASVDLTSVRKLVIGVGDGTQSQQSTADKDHDMIYIDSIRLCPERCFNKNGLDLKGDVNGDCVIDFADVAALCSGWLNSGLSATP